MLGPSLATPGLLPTSGTTAPEVLAGIPLLLNRLRCTIQPEQQQQQQLDPVGVDGAVQQMTGRPLAFTSAKAVRMESRRRAAVGSFRLTTDAPAGYSDVLAQHNSFRAKHQVPPLQWDAALADGAAAFAAGCVFDHDAGSNAGENLYASSATAAADTAASLLSAVRLW
jgi:hypothetical protein